MKKLILCAALVVSAATTFGQGQVGFGNNAAQTITNSVTSAASAGGAAQDDTQVGLYIGNVGDAVSSLQLIGTTTNCFAPGRFAGGNRTLSGWTGTVQLQVRAWLATTDASVVAGVSAPFSYALTLAPAPVVSIGNAGLTPIVLLPQQIVPEPSSIALGLLGLGAVALFRRRK